MRFSIGQPSTFELDTPFPALGNGGIIFVGHMCDLFSPDMPLFFIGQIMGHCKNFDNKYVFQTKNPKRLAYYLKMSNTIPNIEFIGTTIETDDYELIKKYCNENISSLKERSDAMRTIKTMGYKTFVTIEPVMKFNPIKLANLIIDAIPDFINIGADSKKNNLTEPSKRDLDILFELLKDKVEIRNKSNLSRLWKG
jgi:DNA repair photolyase